MCKCRISATKLNKRNCFTFDVANSVFVFDKNKYSTVVVVVAASMFIVWLRDFSAQLNKIPFSVFGLPNLLLTHSEYHTKWFALIHTNIAYKCVCILKAHHLINLLSAKPTDIPMKYIICP